MHKCKPHLSRKCGVNCRAASFGDLRATVQVAAGPHRSGSNAVPVSPPDLQSDCLHTEDPAPADEESAGPGIFLQINLRVTEGQCRCGNTQKCSCACLTLQPWPHAVAALS